MSFAYPDESGGWIEVIGPSVDLSNRTVSQAWVEGLDAEERAELGFVETVEPSAPPEGKRVASSSVQDVGGVPVRVVTYEDIPPAPLPEEVPMYKVRKLLILQGMLDDVEAFLNGMSEPNKSLALVDWNYAPNLVTSSPLALGAKAALGLTDQQYRALVFAAVAMQ